MSGFVSFVSAGPGDPELLTLKAADRLRRADVVLYDDLSAGAILELARPEAELISVGKRAGRASPRQDHVSRLLVDHARTGARVIRLKSGDSGLFGRLEEEIQALRAADIGYEIIPGVTAPSAAAAAAGIPLTRRVAARRIQFVTGHDVTGGLPEAMNMAALADAQAITAVFMARATFSQFAARLLAAGLAPDTPALMAQGVSTAAEKFERHTVAGLAARLEGATPDPAPTLILYGALAE